MNKKRTKAIRNFLALLVLLTTGGTQQVWADDDLDDIKENLKIEALDESECTAEEVKATDYEEGPYCHSSILKVVLEVTPKPGYYTNLDLITAEHVTDGTPYPKSSGSDVISVDEADTDPDKGYSDSRTVTIYWDNSPTPQNIRIKVQFRPIGLVLRNGLGKYNAALPGNPADMQPRATVTFFDGGTTEAATFDPAATFNPTDATYGVANAITKIDNTDGKDRYIIAHIVPAFGYWTDKSLLYAIESADGGSVLARASAPGIESGQTLKLLKADEYDAASPGDAPDMRLCQNGAGWYYYILPGSHQFSFTNDGYVYSSIDGFVVRKFDFGFDTQSSGDEVSYSNKIITITHGTDDDWTAEITIDKLSFPFTGEGIAPTIEKIEIKKGSTTYFSLTEAADIATQLLQPTKNIIIFDENQVRTNAASAYTWFKKYDGVGAPDVFVANGGDELHYEITVPLSVANENEPKGTAANPWLIKKPADLDMFAKCVNVGLYPFEDERVKLENHIDMRNVEGFFPIGGSDMPFSGFFDGNEKMISNLTISPSPQDDLYKTSEGPIINNINIGLFGKVDGGAAGMEYLTLSDCTINGNEVECVNVGGIAAFIDNGASVSNCTVTGCTVTGGRDKHNVGGIVGITGKSCVVYNNSVIDCTVGGIGLNIGGIVGVAAGTDEDEGACIITGNRVRGTTEGSMKVTGGDNSIVGAIFGNRETKWTLADNKYDYNVQVKRGSTVASGYTKRGYYTGTALDDLTESEGAMILVRKATLPAANGNGSVVTFNQVTKGTDCYDIDGNDFYYAVGQPVTLSVTLESRTEKTDIRTFYDELNALTMNDGTTDTDIKDALGFTMPEADATVTATIAESKWFTIPSNNKNWMSFYHEWKDASGASANYIVTDGDGTGKTIEVKTVASVDPDAGTFTLADIQGGVSFCEMPTLFHYADKNDDTAVLPALLKFTPVDPNVNYTQPDKANQFKGTDTGKELAPSDKCYVLNNMGDFIFAYVVTDVDDKIPAHHCYIDLVDNPHFARLLKVAGDATGIDTILRNDSDAVGAWYSLDGRRLDRQPAKKGLYIHKGKKAVIK